MGFDAPAMCSSNGVMTWRPCDTTAHRLVQGFFHPPLYHRTECQWEPTLSELTDGDSGRSPARWRIVNGRSTAPVVDPHSGCFPRRFAGNPVSATSSGRGRRQPGEIEKTSDRAPSTALTSATRLNDALSVRDDISSAMRCRKKNQRCAVVSQQRI